MVPIPVYRRRRTAFRAPDATDRFGSIGNPDLDPEEVRNDRVWHRTPVVGKHDILSITYFENRIKDLIEPNATFTRMENIEKAKIKGIEINLQGRARNAGTTQSRYWRRDPENTRSWMKRYHATCQEPHQYTGYDINRTAGMLGGRPVTQSRKT